MVSKKRSARFSGTAAFSALLLLAACGGGGGTDTTPPITQPEPPQPQPAPAPPPAPAPQPEPAPAPQPEPAPAPQPEPTPQPEPEGVTLASTYTDLINGAQNGQLNPNWPDNTGTGDPIGGLACLGTPAIHVHSLVSIYRDGVRMAIPHSIGLKGCTYELHTHDRSGVVHVEPIVARPLTLGQFFTMWEQPLSRTAVAGIPGPVRFYVIDNETLTRFDGNPADITFAPHKEIVIISGSAPVVLPRYRWPASL